MVSGLFWEEGADAHGETVLHALLQLLDVLQHFGVGVDDLLKAGDHPASQGRERAAHAGVALFKQRAAQLLLRVMDVAYQDGAGTVELSGRLVEVAVVVRRQHSLHLFNGHMFFTPPSA